MTKAEREAARAELDEHELCRPAVIAAAALDEIDRLERERDAVLLDVLDGYANCLRLECCGRVEFDLALKEGSALERERDEAVAMLKERLRHDQG